METVSCLICPGEVIHLPNNPDYLKHQSQYQQVICKLLELCSAEYAGEFNETNGPFFCYSCGKKMDQIEEVLRKLEVLQSKLKTFRQEVERKITATCALSAEPGGQVQQSDKLRDKIASDLFSRSAAYDSLIQLKAGIKEETIDSAHSALGEAYSPLLSFPHFDDEPFDDLPYQTQPSPPSTHVSSFKSPWSKMRQKRDSQDTFNELIVRLQRIDVTFPELKSNPTIVLNRRQNKVVRRSMKSQIFDMKTETSTDNCEADFTAADPFDANCYTVPSGCKIPGCTSSATFTYRYLLARHIRAVHLTPKLSDPLNKLTYPCPCPRAECTSETLFRDKNKLQRHMLHHETREHVRNVVLPFDIKEKYRKLPTKCKEPGCKSQVTFQEPQRLRRHLISVHYNPTRQKKPWLDCELPTTCPVADCLSKRVFTIRERLQRHIRNQHVLKPKSPPDPLDSYEFPTMCRVVGCTSKAEYPDKYKLRRHVRTQHNIKTRPFWFSRPIDQINLQLLEGKEPSAKTIIAIPKPDPDNINNNPSTVICEVCGGSFTKPAIKSHMRIHTGERLNCDDCGSKFITKAGLQEHRKAHHADIPPVYACNLCPKSFRVKRSLEIHMWRHNNVKRKVCTICKEAFMFKIELEEHKRYKHYKELGLEPFQCSICQKILSKRVTLEIHMKTHLGGNRFQCSTCGYQTDRRTDYKEHMDTVHSSEANYSCEKCGKSFKLERRLREHLKYHEDNYQFQCQLCGRRCADGRMLRVHLKRKHTKDDLSKQAIRENVVIEGSIDGDIEEEQFNLHQHKNFAISIIPNLGQVENHSGASVTETENTAMTNTVLTSTESVDPISSFCNVSRKEHAISFACL